MSTVTVLADWKLEQTCDRLFGVCTVEFSPPYDAYDFQRGFVLPNPTHARCAVQAIVYALEAARDISFMREAGEIIIATKHRRMHHCLTEEKSHPGALFHKAQALLGELRDRVTLVYIPRDDGDESFVDLDKGRGEEGLDMDELSRQGNGAEQIDAELRKTRMRGVMAQRLIASGARTFRPLPKKKHH